MCDQCGCGPGNRISISVAGSDSDEAGRRHGHDGHGGIKRVLRVEEDLLAKNDLLAAHNREHFRKRRVFCLNLLSSPGSGKTTLLETTIRSINGSVPVTVIEGDQQTALDAERILAAGAPAVQVNTGSGCHLDAGMVHDALHQLPIPEDSILFIENVGNLVCPAMFDLGETVKVVVISVTEGDDKPLKYPAMFAAADVCVVNKIDLLPYVEFEPGRCRARALQINPGLRFFELSAGKGQGLDSWIAWLLTESRRS